VETLETSLEYLEETVAAMGLCRKLRLSSNDPRDVVATANVIYGLLLQHEQDATYKDGLKTEMQRARADVVAAERDRARYEQRLDAKDREIGAVRNMVKAGENARKEELGKARREIEDLQKRLMSSDRRFVQMQHEIKRKEKEFERLQERLSNYLAERRQKEKAVLDMVSGQMTFDSSNAGHRANLPSSINVKSDEGMKAVIAAYEGKQADLARENRDLKSALASLQAEYKEVLNAATARREADLASGPVFDESFLAAVPNMDADQLRTQLTTKLKALQRRLGNVGLRQSKEEREYGSVVEQMLASDLAIAGSVIRDQEVLITQVMSQLKSAQMKQVLKYQEDAKLLAQRFREREAAAMEEISKRRELEIEEMNRSLEMVKMEAESSISKATEAKELLRVRAENAEESLRKAESLLSMASKHSAKTVEEKITAAVADVEKQAAAAVAKRSEAFEAKESELAEKIENLGLELRALRERLREEKDLAMKATAERDAVMENLQSAIQDAELRGEERVGKEFEALLAHKDAEIQNWKDEVDKAKQSINELKAATSKMLEEMLLNYQEKITSLNDEFEREKNEELAARDKEIDALALALEDAHKKIGIVFADVADAKEMALQREQELRNTHQRELTMARDTFVVEKASLLSKLEAHHASERADLEGRIKELEARQEELVLELKEKTAAAEQASAYYESITSHYKDLMQRFAPGLGAGSFLESGVARKALEAVGNSSSRR
jgi:hypothetical protein